MAGLMDDMRGGFGACNTGWMVRGSDLGSAGSDGSYELQFCRFAGSVGVSGSELGMEGHANIEAPVRGPAEPDGRHADWGADRIGWAAEDGAGCMANAARLGVGGPQIR